MPFPRTRAEMEKSGYVRRAYTRCQGCNQSMEFWRTKEGKNLPMDPMPDPESNAISHFSTCPKANQFRKKKT